MAIRVVGNSSFVIFQDRRFGYGENGGSGFPANRTVSSTFCNPPFASRSPGMRTGSRFHKSRHQPQTGVVRFAISSTMSMRVPDVGRDGNRWTDFSPVAFACQLPRDRALKTRCGSTTCHSRNVCHTSPSWPPPSPRLWHHHTRKPQLAVVVGVRAGGMQIASCPLREAVD